MESAGDTYVIYCKELDYMIVGLVRHAQSWQAGCGEGQAVGRAGRVEGQAVGRAGHNSWAEARAAVHRWDVFIPWEAADVL